MRPVVVIVALVGTCFACAPSGFAQQKPIDFIDFAHAVAPVLKKHCLQCHGGKESKGGLSMNSRDLLLDADVLQVGKADKSRFIELIESGDPDDQMPPKGRARLSAKEVQVLRRWIDEGLRWEPGLTFHQQTYDPPLRPRQVSLPPSTDGRAHPVDRIVDRYLAEHKVARPKPISDAAFARRVHLDLIGLVPTPEQLDEFLNDPRSDKRNHLVRHLLDSEIAYTEHWLTFWNDLLRNDYTGTGFITGGRKRITGWLYRSLVENKPYDQFVRELIAPTPESEGFIKGIRWRGTVNASQSPEIQFAQNISQSLLGINMKCASCHDSFIDRWTLEETYGLAQVYSNSPLELHRCDKPTGRMAKAGWMFPELGQVNAEAPQPERLKELAALMTHPENGRLTRTIVNRIWHRLLGRGIVHPVDAMHTEPWSEDLLDYLANDFVEHHYDLKQVMYRICTSETYQSATPAQSQKQEAGRYIFTGPVPRRMTAEQFVDAVWQLTGAAPSRFDAEVLRVPPRKSPEAAPNPPTPAGQWIWNDGAKAAAAPGGETLAFRREFKLAEIPMAAIAVVTCDNEYRCWVNGKEVGADSAWESADTISVARQLRQGSNDILIRAKNGGDQPNPAGLFFELRIHFRSKATSKLDPARQLVIASDKAWQWSKSLPNDRGQFPKGKEIVWEAAQPVATQGIWSAGAASLRAAVALSDNASHSMVRASLVKNDSLMRTLGRPNRDQVVTARPTELTMLEAIDLANGQTLADAIAAGAHGLATQHASPRQLAQWMFTHALSRSPTEQELELSVRLLGPSLTSQAVEDFVWAVFMLPEFQLVR